MCLIIYNLQDGLPLFSVCHCLHCLVEGVLANHWDSTWQPVPSGIPQTYTGASSSLMPWMMGWSEPLVSLSDSILEGMVSVLESRATYRSEELQ